MLHNIIARKLNNEEVPTTLTEIFLFSCSFGASKSAFLVPETELKQIQEFHTKYGTTVLNSTMIPSTLKYKFKYCKKLTV